MKAIDWKKKPGLEDFPGQDDPSPRPGFKRQSCNVCNEIWDQINGFYPHDVNKSGGKCKR